MATRIDDLQKAYQRSVTLFKDHEAALTVALDRLERARDVGAPSEIAAAYKAAQRAELTAQQHAERMEQARRAYWMARAQLAEAAAIAAVAPHVGLIEFCHRAGGSLVLHPVQTTLERAALVPRAPCASQTGEPPIVPGESDVLDRAESSHIYLLRGGLAL